MSLRLLLASDFYDPFIGGAERQVQYLATEMVRRGHVASVATVWHAGLPVSAESDGVRVDRLKGWTTSVPWFSSDPTRRFHPPLPDPGIALGLRRLIDRLKPDIVHASGWISYSCAAALLGLRIPLVISVRDYGYSCATRTLMYRDQICEGPSLAKCLDCSTRRYGRVKALAAVGGVFGGRSLLARKTMATHSVSKFVQKIVHRDLLGRNGLSRRARRVIIPDIVDSRLLQDATDSAGVARRDDSQRFLASLPREPFILFVGALQLHKGLGPLLAAYARLESPPPLVLIGSVWPDSPTHFPSSVTVLRNVPHRDVMCAWTRCLFGVVPSIWPDPLPGVVKEAMIKGKPIIGSAVGGIVDMVQDEQTGLLVTPGDVDELARAMARLSADAELRDRLGRTAQQQVAAYAEELIVPQFEGLYRCLADSAARGSC